MHTLLLMVHDMGARPEGTASRAGLAMLGLLSIVGFVPVLASSSVVVGVPRSAGADVAAPAAAWSPPEPSHQHALAVAVVEPAPVSSPAPPPPPEPAAEPAVASEVPAAAVAPAPPE